MTAPPRVRPGVTDLAGLDGPEARAVPARELPEPAARIREFRTALDTVPYPPSAAALRHIATRAVERTS